MKYEIYKITNKVNGKLYIGQTKIGYLNRFKKHTRNTNYNDTTALNAAIIKYGKENFVCELLDNSAQSQFELDELEKKYIRELNTLSPNGYNITIGGEGAVMSHKLRLKRKRGITGYLGVYKSKNTYKTKIIFEGKEIHLGSYNSAQEAAYAYDYKALELFGNDAGLNFPNLLSDYNNKLVKIVKNQKGPKLGSVRPYIKRGKRPKEKRFGFYGIYFVQRSKTWRTEFDHKVYKTKEDAVLAYDVEEYKRNGEYANLNYPQNAPLYERNEIVPNTYRNLTKSKYRGVSFKDGKWTAQICIKRRPKFIGYYLIEEDAAKAYDAKAKEIFGEKAKLNFP